MKKFLLLLVIIPLCGCASTRTIGYLNEDYQNNYKVSKIVVSFEGVDIDEALELEKQIIQKLSAYNVKVIKYRDIISPTKNYTDDERLNKIKESGADALLVLDVKKSSMSNYIPAATHRAADGISTYTTGGMDGTTLTMWTKSSLIDVKNGNTIWNAQTGTTGNSTITFPQQIDYTKLFDTTSNDKQFDYTELFDTTFNDIMADMNEKGLFKNY